MHWALRREFYRVVTTYVLVATLPWLSCLYFLYPTYLLHLIWSRRRGFECHRILGTFAISGKSRRGVYYTRVSVSMKGVIGVDFRFSGWQSMPMIDIKGNSFITSIIHNILPQDHISLTRVLTSATAVLAIFFKNVFSSASLYLSHPSSPSLA